jgi:membrane protein
MNQDDSVLVARSAMRSWARKLARLFPSVPVHKKPPLLYRFAAQVGRRFVEDDCFNLAASLTYTSLLSLVPLVTIALTVAAAFPAFRELTLRLHDFLAQNMLPPTVASTVASYLDQFARSAAGLTAVGVAFLAVTAILLMLTIEQAVNAIWRVRHPRPLAFRILVYWGVLTLGPLLIGGSLTITSYLVGVSLGYAKGAGAASVILGLIPLVLTAAAFTLLYFIVPNRWVQLRHAAIGGLAAALLFEVMKRAFALYIARFPSYTLVYGAFAAVPIFLLWIYLSWLVVLLGAVITAALPDLRFPRLAGTASGSAAFRNALEILRVLILAQGAARPLRTPVICTEARVPREAGEELLHKMASAGWTARVVGDRWSLACDPDVVTVADVYRRLVFDPTGGRGWGAYAPLDGMIERAAAGVEGSIALPIRNLVNDAEISR